MTRTETANDQKIIIQNKIERESVYSYKYLGLSKVRLCESCVWCQEKKN